MKGTLSVPHRGQSIADQTLADTLYESLKRGIVENTLQPGTILTEHTVAARHSVSRAPAREALKRLGASGFVTTRHRVGYVVTHVSVADMEEVFALRVLLEPLATELAVPQLAAADIATLQALASGILRVSDAPVEQHGALYSRLNADFHREIARLSGNGHLHRVIVGLVDELERVMHMLAYSSAIGHLLEQHTPLLRVMRSGDAIGASRLMREQLERDYAVLKSLVARTT